MSYPKRLALWVNFSADDILEYFCSYFFQEIGFDISLELSPYNLHEMLNPILGKKIETVVC